MILPTIPPSRSRYHPCDPSRPAINFQWTRSNIFSKRRIRPSIRFDTSWSNRTLYPFSIRIEVLSKSIKLQSTKLESSVLEKWIATGGKTVTLPPAERKGKKWEASVRWKLALEEKLIRFNSNGADSCIRDKPDKGPPSLLCRRRIMRVFSPRFPRHRRITDLQRAATDVGLASLI